MRQTFLHGVNNDQIDLDQKSNEKIKTENGKDNYIFMYNGFGKKKKKSTIKKCLNNSQNLQR